MDINYLLESIKSALMLVANRTIAKAEGPIIPSPEHGFMKEGATFSVYRVGDMVRIDLKGV